MVSEKDNEQTKYKGTWFVFPVSLVSFGLVLVLVLVLLDRQSNYATQQTNQAQNFIHHYFVFLCWLISL
ncbi:MAG: hypothetical protein N6V41_01020, partial [Candidatus Portiera aleyrodidarum]|nr:hypothetical protein [Candidatus Portiera aleyrodidarum]